MRAGFQNAVTTGVPLVRYEPTHPGVAAIRRLATELQRITPPPRWRRDGTATDAQQRRHQEPA